jgi:hypothetical protein
MVEFLATDLSDYVAGAVDPDRWRTGEGIIPTRAGCRNEPMLLYTGKYTFHLYKPS